MKVVVTQIVVIPKAPRTSCAFWPKNELFEMLFSVKELGESQECSPDRQRNHHSPGAPHGVHRGYMRMFVEGFKAIRGGII